MGITWYHIDNSGNVCQLRTNEPELAIINRRAMGVIFQIRSNSASSCQQIYITFETQQVAPPSPPKLMHTAIEGQVALAA